MSFADLRDEPNIACLQGRLIVRALIAHGVRSFVVAPGSRSSPLVRAVALEPEAQGVVWTDERGAAFHALGHARRGLPAAVITTSGTAVANLLPAVVEAHMDRVPLVLLTADRPPELIDVGANQAIRQPGIFGSYVGASVDLPLPGQETSHHVGELVGRAVTQALARAGPVHVNCRFREPLAPTRAEWDRGLLDGEATLGSDEGAPTPAPDRMLFDRVAALVRARRTGVIVLATAAPPEQVETLVANTGWPLIADVRSNHRLGRAGWPHLDRALGRGWKPEVVLQIGARITSKHVLTYLEERAWNEHIVVARSPPGADPTGTHTLGVAEDPTTCVHNLAVWLAREALPRSLPPEPGRLSAAVGRALARELDDGDELSEPFVARHVSRAIAPGAALFLSNSMPIRDVQDFAVGDGPAVPVGTNRGASGIDGIVSTAAGFAAAHARPTTLLIGDQAFLHDLNALAALHQIAHPLTIVLVNNGGGGIFKLLPIGEFPKLFTPWFDARHDFDFEGVCRTFRMPYVQVETRAAFETAYDEGQASRRHGVIEVVSDIETNAAVHRRLDAAIEAALAALR